jgi:hypothetical protein
MAIFGTRLTEERRDARGRGELAPDADLDVAVTLLFGANHARHPAAQGYPADWEERVVDAVLGGMRRSA